MSKKTGKPTLTPLSVAPKRNSDAKLSELKKLLDQKPIDGNDIELGHKLGEGQYGVVFLAVHKQTKVLMAMKQIELGLDDRTLKQIKTELELLHKNTSPYIVTFYGSYLKDTSVCYCMEYMEFGSLDKVYAGGVPENILAKIAFSVVSGLKYMEEQLRSAHRDVKPTNVLINHNGEIKLCDFGISAALVQSIQASYTGCSFYMAPERIDTVKAAGQYDVRSDVWSLGISLVEIGNGVAPFAGMVGVFALLDQIVTKDPPKLTSIFSFEAQDFVQHCLEKNVENRWRYLQLLEHPWIVKSRHEEVDVAGWLLSRKKN